MLEIDQAKKVTCRSGALRWGIAMEVQGDVINVIHYLSSTSSNEQIESRLS
jgi:hypothetical protein